MTEITTLSACELAAGLRARALRAIDVVDAYLERIEARDAEIHAWAHVDPERVRAQARALDAGEVTGPLHGVPVAVKDIIDTVDLPTEYGSVIYAGIGLPPTRAVSRPCAPRVRSCSVRP